MFLLRVLDMPSDFCAQVLFFKIEKKNTCLFESSKNEIVQNSKK